jgi:hypothetical protein
MNLDSLSPSGLHLKLLFKLINMQLGLLFIHLPQLRFLSFEFPFLLHCVVDLLLLVLEPSLGLFGLFVQFGDLLGVLRGFVEGTAFL